MQSAPPISRLIAIFLMLLPLLAFTQTQEDVLLITEARVALKNKDYRTAIASLEQVSPDGKNSALFLQYAGEAYEGVGDEETALLMYENLVKKTSLTPALAEKIANLRYLIRKKKEDQQRTVRESEALKMKAYENLSGTYYGANSGYGPEIGILKYGISRSRYKISTGYNLRIYNENDQLIFEGKMSTGSFQETIRGSYFYYLSPYEDKACYLNTNYHRIEDNQAFVKLSWNQNKKILAVSLRHRSGSCYAIGFRKPEYEFNNGLNYLDMEKDD